MSLQYVGARYVPKFIETPWSDTNEYEALTVVPYDGSTFISKKPVPVGIAISNTEYWTMYSSGGSDPRVPQIIADVATLQGDVATLQTDVAGKADASTVQALETTVAGKADQTALDTVSGDITTLQGDVTQLQTDVAGKADQTALDTVSGDVTTLQGDVTQLQTDVAGKADASTVQALETTVAGKADQSALNTVAGDVSTLQVDVTQLQTDVAGKADQSALNTVAGDVATLQTDVAAKADASTVTALETQLANSHTQYLHTFNNFTAASGVWSGWYQSAHAATVYNESGSVRATGDTLDAPATDAMKEQVAGMEFVTGSNTVTAYAKTQPSGNVTVSIEGVQ